MKKILNRIGQIMLAVGLISYLISVKVNMNFTKYDIIYYILSILGCVFQIPTAYKELKEIPGFDYQYRKFFYALIVVPIIFLVMIYLYIKEYFFCT